MLYLKIAQIQDRQPLLLEPPSRIEEVCEQWPDRMTMSAGFSLEVGNSNRPVSPSGLLLRSQKDREDAHVVPTRGGEDLCVDFGGIQQQLLPDAQDLSWTPTIGHELASTLASSSDLYEQLQNFDGSFNGFQSDDTLDPLLSDNDILQRIAGDGFSSILPLSSIFS